MRLRKVQNKIENNEILLEISFLKKLKINRIYVDIPGSLTNKLQIVVILYLFLYRIQYQGTVYYKIVSCKLINRDKLTYKNFKIRPL